MALPILVLSLLSVLLLSPTLAHPEVAASVAPECENTPHSRSCWGGGFDIDTNYYEEWPDTGRIVEVFS